MADDAQDFAKPCIDALTEYQAAFRGAHARQWAQDPYNEQAHLSAYDALFI